MHRSKSNYLFIFVALFTLFIIFGIRNNVLNLKITIKEKIVEDILDGNKVFFSKNSMFNLNNFFIKSESFNEDKNNIITGKNNIFILPKIKTREYKGFSKIGYYNSNSGDFFIPDSIKFGAHGNNYMNYKDLKGNANNDLIFSKENFLINDDDLFAEGVGFYYDGQKEYLQTDRDTHFIKKENRKKSIEVFSNFSRHFLSEDKNYSEFFEDVKFFTNMEKFYGEYAYLKFYNNKKDNKELLSGLLIENAKIVNKDIVAIGNFAYTNRIKDITILYQNVKITDIKGNTTNSEIYCMDNIKEITVSGKLEDFIKNKDFSEDIKEMLRQIDNVSSKSIQEKVKKLKEKWQKVEKKQNELVKMILK